MISDLIDGFILEGPVGWPFTASAVIAGLFFSALMVTIWNLFTGEKMRHMEGIDWSICIAVGLVLGFFWPLAMWLPLVAIALGGFFFIVKVLSFILEKIVYGIKDHI